MEISSYKKMEYEEELNKIIRDIPALTEKKQNARAEGDLSENTEYDIASTELEQAIQRKAQLESILTEATVVEAGGGPRISLGCFVEITCLSRQDFGKRILRLDAEGSTINENPLNRILSIRSPLGQAINNGVSGNYTIQADAGELQYHVQKLQLQEVQEALNAR